MKRVQVWSKLVFGKTRNFIASFTIFEKLWVCVLILVCFSGIIYIINLDSPMGPFWDENYHISSAEKYRKGVYFNEIHPPLGKLLIASGESLLGLNNELDTSEFLNVDKIDTFPDDYRFLGVRMFPALLAMLSPILFFFIAYQILKRIGISLAITSLYLFNNALVLHFRGAMLDGIQMFFILLTLLGFFKVIAKPKTPLLWLLVMGVGTGLAVATKVNSLIVAILWLFAGLEIVRVKWQQLKQTNQLKLDKLSLFKLSQPVVSFVGAVVLALTLFVGVFAIHFSLFDKVENTYDADESLTSRIGGGADLQTTMLGIQDWMRYQAKYNDNVPSLKEGEAGENGSYPMDWIMMRKTIRYRHQRYTISKQNHRVYAFDTDQKADVSFADVYENPEISQDFVAPTKYWYLVGNPVSWYAGLLGLILSLALVIGVAIFGLKRPSRFISLSVATMLVSYFGYMYTVLGVDRVLYLYHYFVPLLFSWLLLILVIKYLYDIWSQSIEKQAILSYLVYVSCVLIFINFIYFAPFTYGLPMTETEFAARNWVNFWGLDVITGK
jgi:dolichyl-phosphate-mannose--protein O-mannosyl transferase